MHLELQDLPQSHSLEILLLQLLFQLKEEGLKWITFLLQLLLEEELIQRLVTELKRVLQQATVLLERVLLVQKLAQVSSLEQALPIQLQWLQVLHLDSQEGRLEVHGQQHQGKMLTQKRESEFSQDSLKGLPSYPELM